MIFPRPRNSYAHHSIEPLSILTHYMFQLRSAYMGVAMMAFFHLYLKYTQPLFIQALMGLKNLYDAKVVAIHILGKPADGDLKRPFKVASMFGRMSTPSSSMRTGLKWFFYSCWWPTDGRGLYCRGRKEDWSQKGGVDDHVPCSCLDGWMSLMLRSPAGAALVSSIYLFE